MCFCLVSCDYLFSPGLNERFAVLYINNINSIPAKLSPVTRRESEWPTSATQTACRLPGKDENLTPRNRVSAGSNVGVVLSTKHMIVILVVFSALVVGMCASISITCHNKIQERRRREREYKLRRSKEASVEVGLDLSAGNLEAALALQAAEIGARRAGTLPPGVQATPVAGTAPILLRPEDDDNGCYVPEVRAYEGRVDGLPWEYLRVPRVRGSGFHCSPFSLRASLVF